MKIKMDDLINDLKSNKYHERWFAAEILGTKRITKSDQLNKIVKLMKSDIGEVLCWGFGQMKNGDFVIEIGEMLEHPDNYFKWRAAHTLRHIGSKKAVKILELYLEKSKFSETKWRCAEALGKVGDIGSFNVLWTAAQDKSRYVRWKSIWAISLLHGSIENKIKEKILDSKTSEYMLWRCLWVLGRIGNKKTEKWLNNFFSNRKYVSKYMKYQLGLTHLAISKRLNKTV